MSDQITQMNEPPMEENFNFDLPIGPIQRDDRFVNESINYLEFLEFLENLRHLNEDEQKNVINKIVQKIAGVEENEETKERCNLFVEKMIEKMQHKSEEIKENVQLLTDEELIEKCKQCVENIKDKNPNFSDNFKDEVKNCLIQNNMDQESNSQIKLIESFKDELTKK